MPTDGTESDHQQAMALAWSLGAITRPDELSDAGMAAVLDVLGGDESGFHDVSLTGSRFTTKVYPVTPAGTEALRRVGDVIPEHPVVAHLRAVRTTTPVRTSDVLPREEFRRTAAYEAMLEPRGLEHQMTLPLALDPVERSGTVYVVHRAHTDFDDAELDRARVISPVLAALHAAMEARAPSAERVDEVREASRLTPREIDVLRLLASGMTAAAIARARAISPRTVRKHLENAYAKLDVHDRLQAVDYCRRHGLVA